MQPLRLLRGEEMTARESFFWRSCGRLAVRSFHVVVSLYAAARTLAKLAMFIRLSAMTPKPTQRCMPATPW